MSRELMQLALIALECRADIGIKADKVIELLKQELAKLEPEPETTKDPRFTCAECGSENVKVAPMYGSVSRCCDCGHKWSNP
jgi:hypothetical protein